MVKRNYQSPKNINGRSMRYSPKYNVWSNQEGSYVYREYNNPSLNSALVIHNRTDGSKYLNTKSPGVIELDELVADCFKPMPQDGKKYVLMHKDGNLSNCSAFNLEWKQVARFSPDDDKRKLANGLTVTFEGNVYDGKKLLPIVKSIGDADTDRIVAIDPYVEYYRKNQYKSMSRRTAYPDDLMVEAEFVDGNPSIMKRPRVLHKDMDYLNFSYDNLEWAEEDSQEYQEYLKKKQSDIDELTIHLNPGHPNPLMK